MFEKATRQKLRFESARGMLTVEQLWDLPLTHKTRDSLDSLAIMYNKKIKDEEDISFVEEVKKESVNALRLDILKHIIGVKLAEKAQAKQDAVNKTEVTRLKQVLAQKRNKADEALSEADLEKKIKQLQ